MKRPDIKKLFEAGFHDVECCLSCKNYDGQPHNSREEWIQCKELGVIPKTEATCNKYDKQNSWDRRQKEIREMLLKDWG